MDRETQNEGTDIGEGEFDFALGTSVEKIGQLGVFSASLSYQASTQHLAPDTSLTKLNDLEFIKNNRHLNCSFYVFHLRVLLIFSSSETFCLGACH